MQAIRQEVGNDCYTWTLVVHEYILLRENSFGEVRMLFKPDSKVAYTIKI